MKYLRSFPPPAALLHHDEFVQNTFLSIDIPGKEDDMDADGMQISPLIKTSCPVLGVFSLLTFKTLINDGNLLKSGNE